MISNYQIPIELLISSIEDQMEYHLSITNSMLIMLMDAKMVSLITFVILVAWLLHYACSKYCLFNYNIFYL